MTKRLSEVSCLLIRAQADASRSVRLVCLRPPSLDGRVLATSDEQQFIAFEVPANFKPATLNKILGARKLVSRTFESFSQRADCPSITSGCRDLVQCISRISAA